MADPPLLHRWRLLTLGLVAFGAAGLSVELVLLGHWSEPRQWIPLALLITTLVLLPVLVVRPGRLTVGSFRVVMILVAISGIVGAIFHLQANAALEREIDPAITAGTLLWASLGGGIPSLAPGAMIQLGLLGLLAVLRHPAGEG